MVGRFGSAAYTDGFRVYTTVSSERQIAANNALNSGLIEYDQRHGYRGRKPIWPTRPATPGFKNLPSTEAFPACSLPRSPR